MLIDSSSFSAKHAKGGYGTQSQVRSGGHFCLLRRANCAFKVILTTILVLQPVLDVQKHGTGRLSGSVRNSLFHCVDDLTHHCPLLGR